MALAEAINQFDQAEKERLGQKMPAKQITYRTPFDIPEGRQGAVLATNSYRTIN